MNRIALFRVGLSVAAAFVAVAAQAASAIAAPACAATLASPSWADCAGAVVHVVADDAAAAASVQQADAPVSLARFAAAGSQPGDLSRTAVQAAQVVPSIPEPHTIFLMLAGLAAIGFMALRRRSR